MNDLGLEQLVNFQPQEENTLDLIVTSLTGQFQDVHSPDKLSDYDRSFLRRNLSSCPQDVKEMAYKRLVRPIWSMLALFGTAWNSCPERIGKGSESCS